jgi:hypothetical protein
LPLKLAASALIRPSSVALVAGGNSGFGDCAKTGNEIRTIRGIKKHLFIICRSAPRVLFTSRIGQPAELYLRPLPETRCSR